MSWWAQSLMNSLRGGDDEDEEFSEKDDEEGAAIEGNEKSPLGSPSRTREEGEGAGEEEGEEEAGTPTRGVKEDLSELTQTLTRQFWGVASFLAPSPAAPGSNTAGDLSAAGLSDEVAALAGEVHSPRIAGIRSDFAEIGGRFRSGIESVLSHTKAVEISKIASTLLPFGSDEEDDEDDGIGVGAVGINEEVLAFARNVAMHPETWLNFPLLDSEKYSDDFEMSDAQLEHGSALIHLTPEFAALRTELCPRQMSDGFFWKIYFVLLQSRLNRRDAELLSSPQILEARAMLLQDLNSLVKPGSERLKSEVDVTAIPIEENVLGPSSTCVSATLPPTSISDAEAVSDSSEDIVTEKHPIEPEPSASTEGGIETEKHPIQITSSDPTDPVETEKHLVQATDMKIVDKLVIEEEPAIQSQSKDIEEDYSTEWSEDDMGAPTTAGGVAISLAQEEDVSFSDLEMDGEDDDRVPATNSKTVSKDSRTKSSVDWVQLNKGSAGPARDNSSGLKAKESSDWLDLEDFEVE